jgi:hypothetical protein
VDYATLAIGVSTFLAPFLPYLVKGGEEAAKEAGKKFGAAAWERAQGLWGRLSPAVETRPAAREAVQDASTTPDKEQVRAALAWQLEKLLAADQALAETVAKALGEANGSGVHISVSGDRSVGVGGDVSGSTIVTGDQNRVERETG